MSHSPTPQGKSPLLKRAVAALAALAAVGGGGWALSLHYSSEDRSVHEHCVTVNSPNSPCTAAPPIGDPPRSDEPTKRPTRKPAPPLKSAQEVGVPAQIRRSGPATVYGDPSIQGGVKYELDHGHPVNIVCQQWDELVKSPRDGKPTALWDKIGDAQWVSDAMVDTNSDSPVARFCDRP